MDQSASLEVPRRKRKVAASREVDEDVKSNNIVKIVATSNLEVITIDDSDVEDTTFLLQQESLSQLTVSASTQTER